MRNITVFAVLVIILFHAPSVQAQDEKKSIFNSYAFTVAPQFGLFYGQSEEIVYSANSKGNYLSQLLWDIKPVAYYGITLDFSRIEPMNRIGFFSTLSLKNAIPGESGIMEDRDWLSKENDALTHFSSHPIKTELFLWLDVAAGISIPIQSLSLLKVYLKVPYMRFNFSGRDGHGIYARTKPDGTYYPIDDDPRLENFSGNVINYTQEWLIFAPGFSFGVRFPKVFAFDLSFQISPFILCADLDEHLTTNTQYRDYMRGGLFLEMGAMFSFTFNNRMSLSLDCSWNYVCKTRGETYTSENNDRFVRGGEAGAGMMILDTGLLFKIRL
ncbi:MAG: omptin family outer membrane protease [Treponema sp.]|jgi:outer membrane protease|nr:omptin family outer membrane protease [Treponema sp.]